VNNPLFAVKIRFLNTVLLDYITKCEVDAKMDTKANLKQKFGVLIAVIIAVILFMTVPVNAATVIVGATPRSGGTTTITVTLQNAPDEILIEHARGPYSIPLGFSQDLVVTLEYPNGTVVNLDLADAVISATENQGSGTAYGVPLQSWLYGYQFGYGYGNWFGYGYTGNVVDVTFTWNIELGDGTYRLNSDMPSTLNNRGDSSSDTFTVGETQQGGGGSSGGLPPTQGQTMQIDISAILGATEDLKVGDTVTFTINGESHSGTILSLSSTYVIIEFSSTPQRVTVNFGETKQVDLDGDGIFDISVFLEKVEFGKAFLTFSKITAAATTPTGQPAATPAEQGAAPGQPAVTGQPTVTEQATITTQDNTGTIMLFTALIVVAVIAAIVVFTKRSSK